MTSQGEWGPWIEHDGKGCPVKGQYVKSQTADGEVLEHIAHGSTNNKRGSVAGAHLVNCWDWSQCYKASRSEWRVIRYRVRKPRALIEMIERAENMTATKPQEVDADHMEGE